ncbi:unnamed protein product [Protopolystoma xenopodis]|uniref:Uncharacterized protein n=1 Tax=Protopolystoma xenopodis TaxID=117903 RepID=A0A448WUE3_9PLAT|nr:unnamed protein product [Protopolystoma xenopodis]
MLPGFDKVRHMMDESLAPFHRNRSRLPRKQRQQECSSKANLQLVKKNPSSSSGGTELRISSRNPFTRNGSKLTNYETKDSSKPNLSSCIQVHPFHAPFAALYFSTACRKSI